MKLRKTLTLLCVTATALLVTAAGSQTNPLVSKTYLDGEFRAALVADTDALLKRYADEFGGRLSQRMYGAVPVAPADAAGFTEARNKYLSVAGGTSVIIAAGTRFTVFDAVPAELSSNGPGLVDLTAGATVLDRAAVEVPPDEEPPEYSPVSGTLAAGHTYFAQADSLLRLDTWDAARLLVSGGYYTEVLAHPAFRDVLRTDWFYKAVDFVQLRAYFEGDAGKFSPSGTMNRAMFVTVLHRIAGAPEPSSMISPFSDVTDPDEWYYKAVLWCAERGIAQGDNGKFSPVRAVSREQMATFFYRYAQTAGDADGVSGAKAEAFPDFADVSDYARDAFRWACDRGVITGSDGKLIPKKSSTRAQVAQMTLNYLGS